MLPTVQSRREWLASAGTGFGALALNSLVGQESYGAEAPKPSAARKPHHPATAKACIFLFMEGGPSQMDTFDPKPMLNKLAGKPLPESFGNVITSMGESRAP